MKLEEYLKDYKYTVWAKENGLSPSVISRFLAGKTRLNFTNAQKIVQATGGAVSLDSLAPELSNE